MQRRRAGEMITNWYTCEKMVEGRNEGKEHPRVPVASPH
jgi:hypothetical protein